MEWVAVLAVATGLLGLILYALMRRNARMDRDAAERAMAARDQRAEGGVEGDPSS